jgi:hypothetical protein
MKNTKIDIRETGWGDTGWIDLTKDRDQCKVLVNSVMNLPVQ